MGISVAKLQSQTRDVAVQYGNETITVTYRVGANTTRESLDAQKYQREIERKRAAGTLTEEDDEKGMQQLIDQLLKTVAAWDIVEDEKSGKMFPITSDNLWALDPALLSAIAVEIGKDKSPSPQAVES